MPTTCLRHLRHLLLPCLLALGACSTQHELRTAAQQQQSGHEAAQQGRWPQALLWYQHAIGNVELGHGDTHWQANLHQQAAHAAGVACRREAFDFHAHSAAALWQRTGAPTPARPIYPARACATTP